MKRTITKEFKWDSAHRLHNPNYSDKENKLIFGSCNNIHGHQYRLFVTISSYKNELKHGMIINFVDLKKIINKFIIKTFDHKLLLTQGDPLALKIDTKVTYMNNVTTCENQIQDIWRILQPCLHEYHVILEKLKLCETDTSFCELTK